MATMATDAGICARRIPLARGADALEWAFDNGFSDGLPCVPPTEERVQAMLRGTKRSSSEVLGVCPPGKGTVTVEKVAANAVMAGCLPKHFTTVLAAVECVLDSKVNAHGMNATTMGATPCVILNGPMRHDIDANMKHGALGSGSRTNACIGRAIKLVLQNVGGAKLGGTESTTIGTPMKYTMCVAEWEERAPVWTPYHVDRHIVDDASESAISMLAVVSGPHQIVDFSTRDADELVRLFAKSMVSAYSVDMPMINDCVLVVSPEHYDTLVRGGITSKAELRQRLWAACNDEQVPRISKILRNAKPGLIGTVAGSALQAASYAKYLLGFHALSVVPKFECPESLHIVVAGGPAGKFSVFMPCFGVGTPPMPTAGLSRPTSRKIEPVPENVPQHAAVIADVVVLVDPSLENTVTPLQPSPRAADIFHAPVTVGLMDISKAGGSVVLSHLGDLLTKKFPGVKLAKFCKKTFSRPADATLLQQIATTCDVVVAALAD
eukprot:m.40109 g.40109  ORF g.40109 m.40109 type:complete len:494 (-) comp14782_c0_seq5:3556-5037(-)